MFARMKHLAIVSENYALLGKFYEALFGMKTAKNARAQSAVVVGDGYIGLNINPRRPGRQAGLDHFGFEVEDVEVVHERLREKYPLIKVLKRPGNRPFAGLSMHDPAGNVFDLSQKGMENRRDVYVDEEGEQERHIKHFALKVVDPRAVANFYREVFDLTELEKPADDARFYLTDGRITMIIIPWRIMDFAGSGIERPGMDHIGFKVESVEGVKNDIKDLTGKNPSLSPGPIGAGPEGEARLRLFSSCKLGQSQLSDPDGVLIDISEK